MGYSGHRTSVSVFLMPPRLCNWWNVDNSGFIIQFVITLAAAVCVPIIGHLVIRTRMVTGHFSTRWKRPLHLAPKDLMGVRARAFHGYCRLYRYRAIDDEIRSRILRGGHVLVEGAPLSGKTRTLFESLARLPSGFRIAVLRPDSPDLERFRLPFFPPWEKKRITRIVVIDDFERFIQKRNAVQRIEAIDDEGYCIIAAGREGRVLSETALGDLYSFFGDPITIPPVLREQAGVAGDTFRFLGRGTSSRLGRFNGTIGSICLPLEEMAERFDGLSREERDLLTTILGLFWAGLHRGVCDFPTELINLHVVRREQYHGLESLSDRYDSLEEAGFLTTERGMVTVETAYLEEVIVRDVPVLDSIREVAALYARDPLTLLTVAERLFSLSLDSDDPVGCLLAARNIIMDALSRVRSRGSSALRRMLYNNLGAVLGRLFEQTGRFGYARQGIAGFSRSLDEMEPNVSRVEYADTLSNIASLYMLLAEQGGTGYHAAVARDGFYESLTIYRECVIPLKIAGAWADAGRAMTVSAVVERNPAHSARALEAFLEALATYSPGTHPYGYARVLFNLGRCYLALSRFTNREANARRAVEAFSRSLNIRKRRRFPEEYAHTRMEMAGALCVLAREASFEEYTRKALEAYQDAVDMYRELNRPDRCAVAWELMGDGYLALARRMRDTHPASQAVAAYGEALKIWGEKSDVSRHAALQYRIGGAYRTIFRYSADPFALNRAVRAFGVAVRIGEEQNRPASLGLAYQQLGRVLLLLAENNIGQTRTKYSHDAAFALGKALELFETHRLSLNHRAARRSLKNAYDIIDSSESVQVNGKRLLLGHLVEVDERGRFVEQKDPPMRLCTGDGDDPALFGDVHKNDSPDIFRMGYDIRAALRRSTSDR